MPDGCSETGRLDALNPRVLEELAYDWEPVKLGFEQV